MIDEVVSGGQTGVDQAALYTAKALKIKLSGWCPKGGLDEYNKCILLLYPTLKETASSDPDERTQLNVRDSDGTLIIVPRLPLPESIKDGTRLTIKSARDQNKPRLVISLENKYAAYLIREWIIEKNIKKLNIGGPRESNSSGIYDKTCILLEDVFASFTPRPRM